MSASNKYTGIGATITIAEAVVSQVQKCDLPSYTVGEVDITTLASAALQNLPVIPDPGSVSFTAIFDPADATVQTIQGYAADPTNNSALACVIAHPLASREASFTGWVKSFKPSSLSPTELSTYDCEIRLTGAITWSSTS